MTEHAPKTAALMAYAEDLLSPEGRGRLERHLAGCAICERQLVAVRLYTRMAAEAREAPVPEVDFDRMDMALAREADRVSREIVLERKSTPYGWVALAVAAGILVAVYVGWPPAAPIAPIADRPLPEAPIVPAPEVPEVIEAPSLAAVVTLSAGGAEMVREGIASPLLAGALLAEGAAIRTGEDGLVHVRLSEGTGFVATAGTELELRHARDDRVELALSAGRVDSTVAPLRSGSSYTILCAGYAVDVQGTQFSVAFRDGELDVDLSQGGVSLQTPQGERIALSAPSRWSSRGPLEGEPEVSAVRELTAPAEEPTRVTLAHPSIVRWELDGITVSSPGPVELRLAQGEHEVRGWDARARLFTALLPVGRQPTFIEPGTLEPSVPRLRPGTLPSEEISRVLQRAHERMRYCYERSLRIHPEVHGSLRLRIAVGVAGEVERVSVIGAEANETAELRQCITNLAQNWTFPPPGGPVTFEVPLAFSARP